MGARKSLNVFLHGRRIGELKGSGLRLAFQYDRAVLTEYGAGSILLSLSLPVSRKKFDGSEVYAFFNGLLPEGQMRSHIATETRLSIPDVFGLLQVLGADCAGAVQILPAEDAPEVPGAAGQSPLTSSSPNLWIRPSRTSWRPKSGR